MKFTLIFAFFALVAACFMLPAAEAATAQVRDTDAFSGLFGTGAAMVSSAIKGVGDGMTSMIKAGKGVMETAQKTASDGMTEFNKDMQSLVNSPSDKTSSASGDTKTEKKQ